MYPNITYGPLKNKHNNMYASYYPAGSQQSIANAAATINNISFLTRLTNTAASSLTLADGLLPGQMKRIMLVSATHTSTISKTTNKIANTVALTAQGDYVVLMWTGRWIILEAGNVLNPASGPTLS